MEPSLAPLLTVAEAAKLAGVPRATFYRLSDAATAAITYRNTRGNG